MLTNAVEALAKWLRNGFNRTGNLIGFARIELSAAAFGSSISLYVGLPATDQ
jgi:hypothetical protein